MTQKADYCISCGVKLIEKGYVRFPCPSCQRELGRCVMCRHQTNPYTCPKCEFQGP
ncbi:MAG: zinc finger domain-containing protein [ANME-2 cluster archaeon]|nr:zinc finger domain-containing protein [ANME-2 cluster archaeon]